MTGYSQNPVLHMSLHSLIDSTALVFGWRFSDVSLVKQKFGSRLLSLTATEVLEEMGMEFFSLFSDQHAAQLARYWRLIAADVKTMKKLTDNWDHVIQWATTGIPSSKPDVVPTPKPDVTLTSKPDSTPNPKLEADTTTSETITPLTTATSEKGYMISKDCVTYTLHSERDEQGRLLLWITQAQPKESSTSSAPTAPTTSTASISQEEKDATVELKQTEIVPSSSGSGWWM